MNAELQWKLQAWVDGELPERDARHIGELVSTDKEAEALATELRLTRAFLTGNPPEATLPESREFYWGKIQRAIERLDQAGTPAQTIPWSVVLRRLLAPLSGVALVVFLSIVSLNLFHPAGEDAARQLVETENLSEHVGSISYRSHAENMFVVYLYANDTVHADAEVDPEAAPYDDLIIQ